MAELPASAPPDDPEREDVYFSVDVETDGPIPGVFSMLSFAIVPAGRFGAGGFTAARRDEAFYTELAPISDRYEPEAIAVSGLDRPRLVREGEAPEAAMGRAAAFIEERTEGGRPVMVAYPLGFDWMWMSWYFARFAGGSPFGHSRGFDLKTAASIARRSPIAASGRASLPAHLQSDHAHTHHAKDDAIAQAEIFARVFREVYRDDQS